MVVAVVVVVVVLATDMPADEPINTQTSTCKHHRDCIDSLRE